MQRSAYGPSQKWLAEFAGTFGVVLVAMGAAAAPRLGRLATLPLGPLAGLGPAAAAVAYGIAYGAAIAAMGHISGGHFNPAVTVAYWVRHRMGTFAAAAYIVAQLAGAWAAAHALRLALPATAAGASLADPPVLAAGMTRGPALLIEAAMSFALVLALWATVAGRARPHYRLGGIVAGAVLAAAAVAGAPYTGGVVNPARSFGPALAARLWAYQGVYWVGPLAGAVAAATLYDLLFRRNLPQTGNTGLPKPHSPPVPENSSS